MNDLNSTLRAYRLNLIHCLVKSVLVFGHHLDGNSCVLVIGIANLPADDFKLDLIGLTDVKRFIKTLRVKEMTHQAHCHETKVSSKSFFRLDLFSFLFFLVFTLV